MPWGWQAGTATTLTMTATVTSATSNTVYTTFCATPTATSWWGSESTVTPTATIYAQSPQHLIGQYQRQQQLANLEQQMLNAAYNAGLGGHGEAGRIAAPAVLPDFEERRRRAEERAQTLLLSMLNRRERAEFKKDKAVVVRGSEGGLYRVTWGRIANIEVLDRSRQRSHRLCVHPNDPALPVPDVMLAQLLHLKANENEVLRVANRHP